MRVNGSRVLIQVERRDADMGHNVADDEVMRCHKLGGTEEGEGILARVMVVRRHRRGV